MPITKLRGSLQVRENSVTSDRILDHSITGDDIAQNSLDGSVFVDGSIPAEKIDLASFAGDGLSYNLTTSKFDLSVDLDSFLIDTDILKLTDQVTQQGNTFNGAEQLVKLLANGKLPILDGSNLTNISGTGTVFIDLETPSGSLPGTVFTLSTTPTSGSLHLYVNGQVQKPGAGNDYTISGSTVTMLYTVPAGSSLMASYRA